MGDRVRFNKLVYRVGCQTPGSCASGTTRALRGARLKTGASEAPQASRPPPPAGASSAEKTATRSAAAAPAPASATTAVSTSGTARRRSVASRGAHLHGARPGGSESGFAP
jgi:hypothetical protein